MYDAANLKKLKTMKELAPEGMAAFDALNAAVFKDGALSVKVKELIAVAVAMTVATDTARGRVGCSWQVERRSPVTA